MPSNKMAINSSMLLLQIQIYLTVINNFFELNNLRQFISELFLIAPIIIVSLVFSWF